MLCSLSRKDAISFLTGLKSELAGGKNLDIGCPMFSKGKGQLRQLPSNQIRVQFRPKWTDHFS